MHVLIKLQRILGDLMNACGEKVSDGGTPGEIGAIHSR